MIELYLKVRQEVYVFERTIPSRVARRQTVTSTTCGVGAPKISAVVIMLWQNTTLTLRYFCIINSASEQGEMLERVAGETHRRVMARIRKCRSAR